MFIFFRSNVKYYVINNNVFLTQEEMTKYVVRIRMCFSTILHCGYKRRSHGGGRGGWGLLESPQLLVETNFVIISKLTRNWRGGGGDITPNVFICDIKYKKCKR
jgi:hypothetical protein